MAKYRRYIKYEFCKAVKCPDLVGGSCIALDRLWCNETANSFHQWLRDNDFQIVKEKNEKFT